MGVSQSMIDSIVTACSCINHLHVNCKSAICSFDVDTKDNITVDTLPSMSRIGSKTSVASGVLSSNEDENENMDSFRTLPPPADFITTNEHNHHKILTNNK